MLDHIFLTVALRPRYHAAQVTEPDGYSLEFVYKAWQQGNKT